MSEPEANKMEGAAPVFGVELQRYMDGRLSPAEQQQLEERLKTDAATRRTLDAMREEVKLLREGLEHLSEPPYKIADKVMQGVYEDYRRRMAAVRARRLRNRFVAALSAAALLMLAVWMVRPRDPAGEVASGNRVNLLRGDVLEPLSKHGKLHEGDVLVTGRGEFARLRFADGSIVDLDEDSRLVVETVRNGTAILQLEAGRAGIEVGGENLGFTLKTGAGQLQADPGAALDVWLPAPSVARMPQGLDAWKAAAPAEKPGAAPGVVALAVQDGTVYIHTPDYPRGLAIEALRRVVFGPGKPLNGGGVLAAPHALDSRREAWAAADGSGPQDRVLLGLFAPFDFQDLSRRFGLQGDLPGGETAAKAMQTALSELQAAGAAVQPADIAARLSHGQQLLREVAQGFPLSFEGRRRARVLEGLAHYERGRVLQALNTAQGRSGAQAAFLAATVAFNEAMSGGSGEESVPRAPGLAELKLAPRVDAATRLRDLSADESAFLLAEFYRPWALFHMQETGAAAEMPASDAVQAFDAALELCGRSVEGLAARYGKALALQRAGRTSEALAALDELSGTSVAGLNNDSLALAHGLRQAAHVERVRIHAVAGQSEGVNAASEEFRTRYPLDADGPAGQAIRDLQHALLFQSASKALQERRFDDASRFYVAIFSRAGLVDSLAAEALYALRLDYLEALIGKEDGRTAVRVAKEAEKLAPSGRSAAEKARADVLIERARALAERQKREAKAEPAAKTTIELDLTQ